MARKIKKTSRLLRAVGRQHFNLGLKAGKSKTALYEAMSLKLGIHPITCARIAGNKYRDDLSKDHAIIQRAEAEGVNTSALQHCNYTDTEEQCEEDQPAEEQLAEEQPTEEHPPKAGMVSISCFTYEYSEFLRVPIGPITLTFVSPAALSPILQARPRRHSPSLRKLLHGRTKFNRELRIAWPSLWFQP